MRRGRLSYSKLRALTRVATPENEDTLLEMAEHATAAQLERLVRGVRAATRADEERERHQRRSLTLYPAEDGSWVIRGRLDPEVGAVLAKALEAAADQVYQSEDRDASPTPAQRCADAIGLLAEAALRGGELRSGAGRADRYQVVLHLERSLLGEGAMPPGPMALAGSLDHGLRVSAETARRIACDAGLVSMIHDEGGRALDVGRRSRVVSPALRRALEHRDRGCRFPGCSNTRCDAHHVVHWCDGGETRPDNLVLLCRPHHRALHEQGFRVTVTADPEVSAARVGPCRASASTVPTAHRSRRCLRRRRCRRARPRNWVRWRLACRPCGPIGTRSASAWRSMRSPLRPPG
jgi:hypothetical protein